MLDQLVESKSHSIENTRRNELLLGVMVLSIVALLTAWTTSLFGKDYGMGSGDLELSTLVAPVPVPEEEPPPKEEPKPQKDPNVDVRKELIQNIMQSPVKPPDTTSVERNRVKEMRLNTLTVLGEGDSNAKNALPDSYKGPVNATGTGSDATPTAGDTKDDEPPPPTVKKAPPKTISGGVLNGKAVSLPKPAYPAAARAVRASGAVQVQVLIDETGKVVSASAAGGHPLLQAAAVSAARGARFSPTLLSGQPVKVSGIITYNFVP